MEATIAPDALAATYQVLRDLGGLIAGVLALIAALIVYAAGRHQARVALAASEATIAALREQAEQRQRRRVAARDAADERRRADLRFALAREAARVSELAAHRYRTIPLDYGPGRLDTVSRTACDVFRIAPSPVLRHRAGAGRLLDHDIVAAATALDDAVDALNSLLTVDGALGRLAAEDLLTAFETILEAAKRLRAVTTDSGEPAAARAARRIDVLLGAAQG
jgi:hypothetical protein